MNKSEILSVIQHIVDDLSDEAIDLSMDSNLVEDAGLDSIDLLDMLCRAGDCWGIELDLDALDQLDAPTQVASLVDYIAAQVAAPPPSQAKADSGKSQ